jgi:tetratricopeptide (TPR) repeat protein
MTPQSSGGSRIAPWLGTALVAVGLAACGSAPNIPSSAEREALNASQRAARAFQQGHYQQARMLYEEALRIDASIENAEGIAVNLLSLARIEQATGNPAAAQVLLDRVLADSPLALPESRKAESAARKAQLFIGTQETAEAVDWAARAEAMCAQSACTARAAIVNIRSLAAMQGRDYAAALAFAARALQEATRQEAHPGRGENFDARVERANALRLIGEARLALGNAAESLSPLAEALSLDQALGLPQRIIRDLMLLGRANEALGQREQARVCYERALAVGGAVRDRDAQTQARAGLDRL